MSQIIRLHDTEIANGNLVDASHLNEEFDQLVQEVNNKDVRLDILELTSETLTGHMKGLITGLAVSYVNSSRVSIKSGVCRDEAHTELMEVTTPLTVDLAVSGVNGLDTGTKAINTWYYLWIIKNSATGTVAGLLSTSSSNPTMPSGYTKKRLLPVALRNDASNALLPFILSSGWPERPKVLYRDGETAGTYNVLNNGSVSASFTPVNMAALVPPIARIADLHATLSYVDATASAFLRAGGSTVSNGQMLGTVNPSSSRSYQGFLEMPTGADQTVEYKWNTSTTNNLSLYVRGFVVTEV